MKEYLLNLTRYNIWANQTLTGFIEEATESICTLEQKSSFPSIRETLLHLKNAQIIWLNRLQGESAGVWPAPNPANDTLAEAMELLKNSEDWLLYVESLSEQDLTREIEYKNLRGDVFSNTVSEVIAHVMNHSTFHRGQMVTMFRNAGFTALKSTDMITWFRKRN